MLTELENAKSQIIYLQEQLVAVRAELSQYQQAALKQAEEKLDADILKAHGAEGGRVDRSNPQPKVIPPAPKAAAEKTKP
jgi:hypothetical protein